MLTHLKFPRVPKSRYRSKIKRLSLINEYNKSKFKPILDVLLQFYQPWSTKTIPELLVNRMCKIMLFKKRWRLVPKPGRQKQKESRKKPSGEKRKIRSTRNVEENETNMAQYSPKKRWKTFQSRLNLFLEHSLGSLRKKYMIFWGLRKYQKKDINCYFRKLQARAFTASHTEKEKFRWK